MDFFGFNQSKEIIMDTLITHTHVVSDDNILEGEPHIRGTKTPVRAIVELWRLGIPPEEIPDHLPHITLAQVFDALGYYTDYQAEIIHYIEINRVPDTLIHPAVKSTRASK
jgi:uncharacterized protein (DUF433 family)